jgi:hypothetical protein
MKIKVKENETLVRDTSTNAILCVNKNAVLRHNQKMRELSEKESQKNEINMLKQDVSDIKTLLQQIIQRLN